MRLPGRRVLQAVAIAIALYLLALVLASQGLVSPPRPRVSDSVRPVIGIGVADDGERVVVTTAVPPASDAGLHAGDIVKRIDGEPIFRASAVAARIAAAVPGDRIRVEAHRNVAGSSGEALLVDIAVETRPVSPADVGLPYEDIAFDDSRGRLLRGWFVPPPAGAPVPAPGIVYGHGNGTDRRHWMSVAPAIHAAGFGQVLFDFAGRGDSAGKTITMGADESDALRAALRFLRGRIGIDATRVAMAGRSMGAAAALMAAPGEHGLRAVVVDSPYTDLPRVVDDAIRSRWLPAALIRPPLLAIAAVRARYEPYTVRPVDAVPAIPCAVLLIHGESDRIVPFAHALDIAAAGGKNIHFLPLENTGHNDRRPPEYADRIVSFLQKHTARDAPPP